MQTAYRLSTRLLVIIGTALMLQSLPLHSSPSATEPLPSTAPLSTLASQ